MKRTISKAFLSGNQVKITVKIESSPCEKNSMDARREQVETLRQLSGNLELLNCGYVPFEKFSMSHDGEKWTVTMEAIAEE